MARLTGTTGPLAAIGAFLQGFADARLKRAYFDLQWANSPSNPERLAALRSVKEADRAFQIQLEDYRSSNIATRQTDLENLRSQNERDLIDYRNTQSGETFRANTPDVVDRARQVAEAQQAARPAPGAATAATLALYRKYGLIPSGAKPIGGKGGPLSGLFKTSDFLKIMQNARMIADQAGRAEMDQYRGSFGAMEIPPEKRANLILLNPQVYDKVYNDALLSQIRPFVGSGDRWNRVLAHLNGGGSISDLFLEGDIGGDLPPVPPAEDEQPQVDPFQFQKNFEDLMQP